MDNNLRVLILEDLPSDAELAQRELLKVLRDPIFKIVDNEQDYVNALKLFLPELIISDYKLPSFDGMSALKIIKEKFSFIPFIVLTGSMNEDTAVDCMKAGADDYVIKEHIKRLGAAALNSIKKKEIEKERDSVVRALKESEDKYRNLFSSANDAILLMKNSKFVDCNDKAVEMYNCKKEEVLSKTLSELSPEYQPDGCSSYTKSMEKISIVLADRTQFFEWKHLRCDGTTFDAEISLNRLNLADGVHIQAIVRDVTERKITENKIRIALEKAKESDRLKSAFLANMSHEIRTPMNGILGFSKLLEDPGLDGKKKKKFIGIIQKSGNRMLATINDLVDVSRIEAGQVVVTYKNVEVIGIVFELFHFFQSECEKKGLSFSLNDIKPDDQLVVWTDEHKLIAILTNLIKNAIKYTKQGSISIGLETKGGFIEFYVRDTGIGIPEDRMEAIFDRFVQADIEDKDVYEGSGLGLTITKAYVEMLQGNIWVTSQIGKGSEFTFIIPKIEHAIDSVEIVDVEEKNREERKLKIMVVEDDDVTIELLAILLVDIALEILQARNGLEAVDLFKNHSDIDLILMDIKMPVMDGYEATRQIRLIDNEVVIIGQSAYAMMGDSMKAIEAGCNDYLPKPIDKMALVEKIDKWLAFGV